jgi:hypothetical protein
MIAAEQAPPKARRAPRWVIAAGALLAIAGYLLGHTTLLVGWKGGDASQLNGICTSAIGQLAQVFSAAGRTDCSKVALVEQASGWMIVAGLAAVAAGLAWSVSLARQA